MYTLYGIPNCNTVKKAIDFLKENNISFTFHDYKKKGIATEKLIDWATQVHWEVLINKKGSTYKLLDATIKESINSQEAAFNLVIEKPSIIKRPIIEFNQTIVGIGFNEETYRNLKL